MKQFLWRQMHSMATANAELIPLLASQDATIRTIALHWLSEGYANEAAICRQVWHVWDTLGAAEGFPEFPMLSHFPIAESPRDTTATGDELAAANAIEESCRRASQMVAGAKLTSTESRSAGKLIEQLTRLAPHQLAPHVELLQHTVAQSKIFFRVDVPGVHARVGLMNRAADELAAQLDESIESLTSNRDDAPAVHRGLHALEALRRGHPNYLQLAAVLEGTPPDHGPRAISFQLALQSLVHFAEPGLESALAPHLHDHREAVYVTAIDALVRAGTPAAAEVLLQAFPTAEQSNQQWIARGLQRICVKGLAREIAGLRAVTQEPHLWIMLLVAEIRQMDLEHADWLAAEVNRVSGHSYALINALTIYNTVHAGQDRLLLLQSAFVQYLARTEQRLMHERADKEEQLRKTQADERRKRNQARQAELRRFRRSDN